MAPVAHGPVLEIPVSKRVLADEIWLTSKFVHLERPHCPPKAAPFRLFHHAAHQTPHVLYVLRHRRYCAAATAPPLPRRSSTTRRTPLPSSPLPLRR
eukprot:CAMPEP_0185829202 /NCGR_PEP_ID=MMETSP1353-20130828/108_1 /TAXON_ID=1077150 /ORGANISM="Erythrolobus australicus, Strain CCMP3124" /LENGTH=96 /DNA_ID=CAMNT_0028526965 /DNA_START=416 /DNA_END=703 /DNA_ORIENTATION=+